MQPLSLSSTLADREFNEVGAAIKHEKRHLRDEKVAKELEAAGYNLGELDAQFAHLINRPVRARKETPELFQHHQRRERTGKTPMFNTSIERKIERLWLESKKLGWSYSSFIICVIEILVVLQHRHKTSENAVSEARNKS
jgi:hypothetical protein